MRMVHPSLLVPQGRILPWERLHVRPVLRERIPREEREPALGARMGVTVLTKQWFHQRAHHPDSIAWVPQEVVFSALKGIAVLIPTIPPFCAFLANILPWELEPAQSVHRAPFVHPNSCLGPLIVPRALFLVMALTNARHARRELSPMVRVLPATIVKLASNVQIPNWTPWTAPRATTAPLARILRAR